MSHTKKPESEYDIDKRICALEVKVEGLQFIKDSIEDVLNCHYKITHIEKKVDSFEMVLEDCLLKIIEHNKKIYPCIDNIVCFKNIALIIVICISATTTTIVTYILKYLVG